MTVVSDGFEFIKDWVARIAAFTFPTPVYMRSIPGGQISLGNSVGMATNNLICMQVEYHIKL